MLGNISIAVQSHKDYEFNIFCFYSIPSGTSPELRHLLLNLLRRNAKDRMDHGQYAQYVVIV